MMGESPTLPGSFQARPLVVVQPEISPFSFRAEQWIVPVGGNRSWQWQPFALPVQFQCRQRLPPFAEGVDENVRFAAMAASAFSSLDRLVQVPTSQNEFPSRAARFCGNARSAGSHAGNPG